MRKPYQAKTVTKFLIEEAEVAVPTICMTNSKLNSIRKTKKQNGDG